MLKKLTTLMLGLLMAGIAMAQVNPNNPASQCYMGARSQAKTTTVTAADIQYWVGTGSNSAILVISWEPTTATPNLAWGFHWDGTDELTAADMMDSIQNADPRLDINGGSTGSFVNEITYTDGSYTLDGDGTGGGMGYWMYMGNNHMGQVGISGWELSDGDVIEWAYITDFSSFDDGMFASLTVTPATDPNPSTPTEITVNAANPDTALVDYWCGTGSNKAVVVIGWDDATPATALCWGVRWNGNTTAMGALDSIVAHDSHFTYTHGGMISNLAYNNGSLNLASPTDWWCYTRNGSYAGAYASQQIANNDVLRLSATCTQSLSTAIVVPNPNPGVNPPSQPSPVDATIAENDILYWVGTGSNSARFIVNWADTCLAWGYRFGSDSVSVATVLAALAAADDRLSYVEDWGFVDNITFTENGTTHGVTPDHYFFFNKNGIYSDFGYDLVYLHNGDYAKFGDDAVSTWLDSTWYGSYWWPDNMLWENPVYAVSAPEEPLPVDAAIPASDIVYWVGTGSNEVRFFISYAEPDTCLAWGYRFSTPTITASQMVADIAAADPRLTIEGDPSYTGDLLYAIGDGDTLRLSPIGDLGFNFWYTIKNGTSAMNGIGESLANGDYFKYGDMNTAHCADPEPDFYCIENVWTTMPTPVSLPTIINPVPEEASIAEEDILYWVGTGSNSARFVVNWADTALAWGYHFDGTTTAGQMMTDIAAADPRFSFEGSTSWINDIHFTENGTTLSITPGHYWMSNINGNMANTADMQPLTDGDMFKWGDDAVSTWLDSTEWDGVWYASAQVWEMTVYPVSVPTNVTPEPEEATIAEEDILFWIGQGIHNYTLIVNWADTALAWGYKSWIDSVSVKEMMDQVMVNDPRFSYDYGGGFVNEIYFAENGDTLRITPGQYWMYNVNGVGAANLIADQYIHDHDMVKFGDPSVSVWLDSSEWGGVWYADAQVWTMTVNPASVAEPEHGPFCGAVGTEGCNAVAATNDAIVAWATACELELGYQNIATEGPRVSYGEAEDATGACDMENNLAVVSLGDGGMATLTFAGHIYNGEGADFAVFENSFDDKFLELAFVEVSSDGEHFVRFPSTSLTQTIVQVGSIGTVDPTMINNLAGKYRHGWGTPFDLEELRDSANLDINHITHVRIVDVVGSIDPQYASYDAFGHMVNDPYPTESYSCGFDLDGVGVMHMAMESIAEAESELSIYPNPAQEMLNIRMEGSFEAQIFDLAGRKVMQAKGSDQMVLNLSELNNGVYMLKVNGQVQKLVVRH